VRPQWLKTQLSPGFNGEKTGRLLKRLGLNTVCSEALCPNRDHCYRRNTAAFLILGRVCTRDCGYCAVEHGKPLPPDPAEAARVSRAARAMGLRYAVITSVTRDDLPDGGAGFFRDVVKSVRKRVPGIKVEVLTPDFRGAESSLETVAEAHPDVFNHNLETVERLFPSLRGSGGYSTSLRVLSEYGRITGDTPTKSGLMLGLGETDSDVEKALSDLRGAGVTILTLGQYLPPSLKHARVIRYISPDEFGEWRNRALAMGFEAVASGPLVRSSYHADFYASPLL
jgi:lipoic acid synthetase